MKLDLDIDTIVNHSRYSLNWTTSVTGVWENATSVDQTSASKGILILYETNQNFHINGISTTTDSVWNGTFSNGTIQATYVNKYNREGFLHLQLSLDGLVLTGTWKSGSESGRYEAKRSRIVHKEEILGFIKNSSVGSRFRVTEGLDLDINTVLHMTQLTLEWRKSVTGVWENASAGYKTSISKGILVLYEKRPFVVGISTTTDSVWTGTFLNGILEAHYVNKHNMEGTLRLQLSGDGMKLVGMWHSGKESGQYIATRSAKVTKQEIVMRITSSTVGSKFKLGL